MNKYNDSKSKFKLGFTIVELLVVIVIIGILAGITIVSYVGISNKAIAAGLQSELSSASRKLSLYNVMYGSYPSALDESGCPTAPNIDSDYCVKYSAGTTFTYTSTGPKNYTLTYTKSNISWRVTDDLTPFAFTTTQITAITNITGAILIGQTLTAGTVVPDGATVSYQWQSATSSNGTYSEVSGATAKTYVITAGDVGKYFKVSVTGTGDYAGTQLSTATSAPVSIIITAMAAISGTTQVGQTLTAGALTPAGATASYQWQSASTSGGTYTDISGATSNTYTITSGYIGKYFKVSITGTGNYVGNQTSAATSSSAQASITSIAAISGTVRVGQTLTAGALTPAAATASYQWQSADTSGGTYTDISGATSNTYAVTVGYIGKYFKVKVTGTGDYIGSQTSAASAVAQDSITAIAAITGTAKVGQTLTAGALSPAGATASYQWQRATTSGGAYANISGATGATYTAVSGDLNYYLKVVATGTGNYVGAQTSAATTIVLDLWTDWYSGVAGTALEGKHVYKNDIGSYAFKTDNSLVTSPQGITYSDPYYPPYMTLVSPQTNPGVDFSAYPAQNACKALGGRVPNMEELTAIYSAQASYGSNFQQDYYWSATEYNSSAYAFRKDFSDGTAYHHAKTNGSYVRCVSG